MENEMAIKEVIQAAATLQEWCKKRFSNSGAGCDCAFSGDDGCAFDGVFPQDVIIPHRKTYAEDFFEKFPKAQRDEGGAPTACRDEVYDNRAECDKCGEDGLECRVCWNAPMESET